MNANKVIEDVKSIFKNIDKSLLLDQNYLEQNLIVDLGLNNENLTEQPIELSEHFGGGLGLRIWQYPNQFSKYMVELSKHADKITSYLEIGCRHGGTYVLTTEFLKVVNTNFKRSTAIDIIEANEILQSYVGLTSEAKFIKMNSGSQEFKDFISSNFFDLIFIDGDHSYEGVKSDAEITRDFCNIQVFHDTVNDACPGVGIYWNELKNTHSEVYDFFDFTDQYDSVDGTYLGIGVAVRKDWITI
jgi:hypothetical protein